MQTAVKGSGCYQSQALNTHWRRTLSNPTWWVFLSKLYKLFILEFDLSGFACGVVLSQVCDKDNELHPLSLPMPITGTSTRPKVKEMCTHCLLGNTRGLRRIFWLFSNPLKNGNKKPTQKVTESPSPMCLDSQFFPSVFVVDDRYKNSLCTPTHNSASPLQLSPFLLPFSSRTPEFPPISTPCSTAPIQPPLSPSGTTHVRQILLQCPLKPPKLNPLLIPRLHFLRHQRKFAYSG
ncbi:hypothetical protein VP01_957g3 [Puccinia sorghi]|uniref:Uncharacterized protein n=1 Tax=Puccinia sorghi TaxID=27349 RepID=A0A0L6U683_9BASI|nr:hypothetical protein VP01_957g3 [Puccinia sorghi]